MIFWCASSIVKPVIPLIMLPKRNMNATSFSAMVVPNTHSEIAVAADKVAIAKQTYTLSTRYKYAGH